MNSSPRPNPAGPTPPQKPTAPPIRVAKPMAAPRPKPAARNVPGVRMPAPRRMPVVPQLQTSSGRGFAFLLFLAMFAATVIVGWRIYGGKITIGKPDTTAATHSDEVPPAGEEPSTQAAPDNAGAKTDSVDIAAAPAMPAAAPMANSPAKDVPPMTVPEPTVAKDSPFAEPLVLDGVAGMKANHVQRRERLLREAMGTGKWNDYLDLLRRSLAIELKKGFSFDQPQSYDRFLGNPVFYTALVQATVIAGLPEDARNMIQDYQGDRDFFLWLLTNTPALEDWLLAVRPEDRQNNALKSWAIMQREMPEARDKYRALALACALVFDKEFKPVWNGEQLSLSAALRFNTYKTLDERGALETHITQMSPQDLVWVVAAPVPDSELEWARKNVHLKQRDWGRAYGMVPYDMDKAVTGKQKKAYDAYTFEEILEKGGICTDRAYFGVNTARALGIPAAEVGGDGPMGGHAWMRWKADKYTWKEDGRIGGYGAGRTTNPQTGRTISELEFVRLSDRRANSDNLNTRAFRFLWLSALHEALGDKARAEKTMEFAFATNRDNAELWEAKLALWGRIHANDPVEDWKDFLGSWKRHFSEDTELVAEARRAEEKYVFPRLDTKSTLQAMRADARAFEHRRDGAPPTADEIADLYQRQGQALAKDKQYDAIHGVYHRAFREYGGDPAAFKRMARDYFGFVRADDAAKVEAAREIENAFERFLETRDLNWFVTGSQNSALQVVADCWREAGQPERAERMAKEMEKRTKRSKREAL